MFTYLFQFFFTSAVLGLIVVAILTHRADRREVVQRANSAYLTAQEFVTGRYLAGYYAHPNGKQEMKKDLDNKYIELISQ